MAILTQDDLHALRSAILSAQLGNSRASLLTAMDPNLRGELPTAPTPGQQVLVDLDALNGIEALADGSVPLAIWLRNALVLAAGRPEVALFDAMLAKVQGRPAAPPRRDAPDARLSTGARPFGIAHVAGAMLLGLVAGAGAGFAARGPGVPLAECRDSLARLETQSKLVGVTADDLKNGIGGHISRCRGLLDGEGAR